MFWYELKLFASHASGVSMDALHVLTGVVLQLAAGALLKVRQSSWRPWLLVFALAVFNELADLWVERWPHPGMQLGEGVKDIVLTMFLPTLLVLVAKRSEQAG